MSPWIKLTSFELLLAQDSAQTLKAGVDVKYVGRIAAFQQCLRDPRANETFGTGNEKTFRLV